MRWPLVSQRTGRCRPTSTSGTTLKPGQTKFCQLRARRMSGCNSQMYTRNEKKIVSLRPAKRKKNPSWIALVTARGRRVLSEKNCTRPAGGLPICCRKSCKSPPGEGRLASKAVANRQLHVVPFHFHEQRARKSNRKNPDRDDGIPRNVGRGKTSPRGCKNFPARIILAKSAIPDVDSI